MNLEEAGWEDYLSTGGTGGGLNPIDPRPDWQQGVGVKVPVHTLTTVPGLPEEHASLLRFGHWLEAAAARDLDDHLDGWRVRVQLVVTVPPPFSKASAKNNGRSLV